MERFKTAWPVILSPKDSTMACGPGEWIDRGHSARNYVLPCVQEFSLILAPETKVLGDRFSMKFGFIRGDVNFVKIVVFHRKKVISKG